MYVVVVEFEIASGKLEAFMPLMLENARASVEHEPGCCQFDVCTEPERPNLVFLYEVYDSRAAFEEHCRTPHFLAFDGQIRPMVMAKRVRFLARV
jgi:(4S)-4-hydroxy-5-phosphonooxypentane-2,3-dione isomerase